MNKLIVLVGTSGVGKTTLARALDQTGFFESAFESHADRPFQLQFKRDPKYAFANQIDYLLFRADQERQLRTQERPALMDGGLDQDYYGFTRLFHAHGWLTEAEFDLCRRLYTFIRTLLPAPNLVIAMSAPPETIQGRLAGRERINIASVKDAEMLTHFLNQWVESLPQERILHLDASQEGPAYPTSTNRILSRLELD